MRVLVLSKRQYLGKDLLDDRFFRNYEIPEVLAARGHSVGGLALSYRNKEEGACQPGQVSWQSFNARTHFVRYLRHLTEMLHTFHPDVVWASSDAFHGIIAWQLSRRAGMPFVVDLYDNYESFGATSVPGVLPLFQRACRASSGLTFVSSELEAFIAPRYNVRDKPRLVLGNAVRADVFVPRPKLLARERLRLPREAQLIGTAGALTEDRGIEVLFQAFHRLAEQHPTLWLVVAGQRDDVMRRYRHDRLLDLGMLSLEEVALVFSALDVAVICNIDSEFGRYCFPQKFYEIVACGTPVVAADVGEMRHLLAERPDCRFRVGSVDDLQRKVLDQLANPTPVSGIRAATWADRAQMLEGFLQQVVARA